MPYKIYMNCLKDTVDEPSSNKISILISKKPKYDFSFSTDPVTSNIVIVTIKPFKSAEPAQESNAVPPKPATTLRFCNNWREEVFTSFKQVENLNTTFTEVKITKCEPNLPLHTKYTCGQKDDKAVEKLCRQDVGNPILGVDLNDPKKRCLSGYVVTKSLNCQLSELGMTAHLEEWIEAHIVDDEIEENWPQNTTTDVTTKNYCAGLTFDSILISGVLIHQFIYYFTA